MKGMKEEPRACPKGKSMSEANLRILCARKYWGGKIENNQIVHILKITQTTVTSGLTVSAIDESMLQHVKIYKKKHKNYKVS